VNDGFHPEVLADGGPRDESAVADDFHDESDVDEDPHDELAVGEDSPDDSAALVDPHGEEPPCGQGVYGEVHDELADDEDPPGWDVDYCLPPWVPLHPLSLKFSESQIQVLFYEQYLECWNPIATRINRYSVTFLVNDTHTQNSILLLLIKENLGNGTQHC
jgi:hypothetical protein